MAGRPAKIDDLFRIGIVNDAAFSPDGQQVLCTVTHLDRDADNYKSEIWLCDTLAERRNRLTSGEFRDSSPIWSPDGRQIAFTSNRDYDGKHKGQLWLLAVDGGEARRLTDLDNAVEYFTWSPNSREIACVSKVRDIQPNPESDVRVISTPRFRFDGEGYLDDSYRQIFVVDVETYKTEQLTDGTYEHSGPAWSPSGYELAFAANLDAGWEYAPHKDIYVMRPTSRTVRKLTDSSGNWSQPSWSSDGTRIACFGTQHLDSASPRTELFLISASDGTCESLTTDIDRSFSDGGISDIASFTRRPPIWSVDGQSILAVYSDQGSVRLGSVALNDGSLTAVTGSGRCVGSISQAASGAFAYCSATAIQPGELFMANSDGEDERCLSNINTDWGSEVDLIQPVAFEVESPDGVNVQGWIIKPPNFSEDASYPLVLQIHGGPFGMYAESLMHEFQVLAAQGYVVLYTNPRGSTGYGDEFAEGLHLGWGEKDMPDLMAAVDYVVAQGYIDESRMGVLGGSYGGFMTNWVVGHIDRFSAAVTMRTLSNLYSAWGTDDIFFGDNRTTFGATPWEDPEIFWRLSPITYVDQMTTPMLIIQSEADYRCPMGQAEELYIFLKRLGRDVEMVRFPDESHGLSRNGKPKHRVERLEHIVNWFDRYL